MMKKVLTSAVLAAAVLAGVAAPALAVDAEPNDTYEMASQLSFSKKSVLFGTLYYMKATTSGYISSTTDVDWYKMAVGSASPFAQASGTTGVTLNMPAGTDYDFTLYKLMDDGSLYKMYDGVNTGFGVAESYKVGAFTAGTYYVKVYSKVGATSGATYSLEMIY